MKLALRDLTVEDASKIALWKSDPVLSHQLTSNFQDTDECAAINWIKTNSSDPNQCLWGICIGEKNVFSLVGVARLMYIDRESSTAELGIYIGDQSNQNQGIGGGALDLILKKALIEMKLEKVYLKVVSFNKRAISLYFKRKFKVEGTLRQHFHADGSFHDVICMAIFRKDFT